MGGLQEGKAGLGESTVGKIPLSHTQWCAGHSTVVERTASTSSPDGQNPLVLDLISGIPESGHLSSGDHCPQPCEDEPVTF